MQSVMDFGMHFPVRPIPSSIPPLPSQRFTVGLGGVCGIAMTLAPHGSKTRTGFADGLERIQSARRIPRTSEFPSHHLLRTPYLHRSAKPRIMYKA